MNKDQIKRLMYLQQLVREKTITPGQDLELEQMRAILARMPELPDPDGPGPLTASRPQLDGTDPYAEEEIKEQLCRAHGERTARFILDLVLGAGLKLIKPA